MTLARTTMDSPVGRLTLFASDTGLRAVLWLEHDEARVRLGDDDVVDDDEHPVLRAATAQLEEYFAGDRSTFDLPLDPVGTPFQQKSWDVLRTIPFGTTISYGEQARRLGTPSAMRAVGAANGRNPISIIVPCHRVVGSDGSLTGFGGGLDAKAWLLEHESREPALPGLGPRPPA